MPIFRFIYQLVVVDGVEMNQNLTPVIVMEAKQPPLFLNPSDLGGSETSGHVYTMGVRLKSEKVYNIRIITSHILAY